MIERNNSTTDDTPYVRPRSTSRSPQNDGANNEDAITSDAEPKRKKSKLFRVLAVASILAVLLIVSASVYLAMASSKTSVRLKVSDQKGSSLSGKGSEDQDATAQAIAIARAAAANSAPPTTLSSTSTSNLDKPVSQLASITAPLADTPKKTLETEGSKSTPNPGQQVSNGAPQTHVDNNTSRPILVESKVAGSQQGDGGRNKEQAIRCAPSVPVRANQQGSGSAQANTRFEPVKPSVTLPSFGSMLPVQALGSIITLRQGGLSRFALTRDLVGNGWTLQKGTVFVGVSQGSDVDRAFISIVGFIDPGTDRFVRITGDVLGGDGANGIKGKRRSPTSAWSKVLSNLKQSLVGVGEIVASSSHSVVLSSGVGYQVINPLALEMGGLLGGKTTQTAQTTFVEVSAGANAYILINRLPEEIKGVDALSPLNSQQIAEESDTGRQRNGTGLSDKEFADLISSGNKQQIQAAMPKMTPELRKIAESVVSQIEARNGN